MGNNSKRGKAFISFYGAVFRIHGYILFYCSRQMLTVSHPLMWVRCGKTKFIFNSCEDVSDRLLPNKKKTHTQQQTLRDAFPIGLHSIPPLLPGLQ